VGYEPKFKESEERMKLLYTLGALLLLSTSVMAQQELNPTVPLPVEPVPEVEQAPTPEASPWRTLNRQITCNAQGLVRDILETNGQTIYATGYKSSEYLPMDPFDGIIITRNEITLEYTVLLIKSDLNIACVLAGGQRFEIVE